MIFMKFGVDAMQLVTIKTHFVTSTLGNTTWQWNEIAEWLEWWGRHHPRSSAHVHH
jgi:hypothetical protein